MPQARLELAHLSALASKTSVSTNFTTRAFNYCNRKLFICLLLLGNLERGKRIELSALAWKAKVLPLYEPRIDSGVGDRDRTCIKRICNPRPDHSATHLHIALHPPAVIIVQKDMTLSYPSLVPSTRFPTGTVLALLAAFGFKDYHP